MSNDNGLVDEMEKLEKQIKDINQKKEELKLKIIELSKEKNVNVLFGVNKKCLIREFEKVIYPDDKDFLIKTIKDKGLYDELSQLNYSRLRSKIVKNEIDFDIISLVEKEKNFRVILKDIN